MPQPEKTRVGRPRTSLVHLQERWRAGDRRAVDKIKHKAIEAFFRELVSEKPDGIRQLLDLKHLADRHENEILAALQLPFYDSFTPEAPEEEQALVKGWHQAFRDRCVAGGIMVLVREGDQTTYIGDEWLILIFMARIVFMLAWPVYWSSQPSGSPPHSHMNRRPEDRAGLEYLAYLRRRAEKTAAIYRARNVFAQPATPTSPSPPADLSHLKGPGGQQCNAKGHYLGMTCPPADPDPAEPYMRDGSHLLASERGRRRIDPATGKRMIKRMVLTDEAWPHYEWVEDVDGEFGVGPYGPHCSIWMPDDPRAPSPRVYIKPILEKIGRLDLLHNFMPGPDDEDQSNPPPLYYYPPLKPG